MTGKELANVCSDYVNSFSCKEKEFATAMAKEHRTLQQSFTRLIIAYLREQANEADDGRNHASIEFSKKVIDMIEKENMSFPMI